MWAHGRPRPPAGSMGAEPRPHPLAGLDNPPAHRPGACARPFGCVGCPPPDAPPHPDLKISRIRDRTPPLSWLQVEGGAAQAFSRGRGEGGAHPRGAGGVPLPWSRLRRRAGRLGGSEPRKCAATPFIRPPSGGSVIPCSLAKTRQAIGRQPHPVIHRQACVRQLDLPDALRS